MRLPYLALLLAAWPSTLGVLAATSEPKIVSRKFGAPLRQLHFFDDSEVALALEYGPEEVALYRTEGAGAEWKMVSDITVGQPFLMLAHPADSSMAIILGKEHKHWVTYDKGKTWSSFKTDKHPSRFASPIKFHATDSKKMIFQDFEGCDFFSGICLGDSYYTTDGFATPPKPLVRDRRDCLWAKSTDSFTTGDKSMDADRILCVVKGKYSLALKDCRLLITDNYTFEDAQEPKMGDRVVSGVANIAAVKGYIVAAAKADLSKELALYVTDNTKQWHRAEFMGQRIEEDAYTLLESTNYSIQIDVQTSDRSNLGDLYSSNSNGTYFMPNIDHTNRNEMGIVDFEKVTDIQGILLVNIVTNWKEIEQDRNRGVGKLIESRISIDDGRTWEKMKAGKDTLHVHSVSEQKQNGKVFTSTAPGMVLGNGNTGDTLGSYAKSDLYVSHDAGHEWNKVRDGPHLYEFGGQGSIMVATKNDAETDEIIYSVNFGNDWTAVKLPDKDKVLFYEVTTIPDSTSLKFVALAKQKEGDEEVYKIYSIDFTGLLRKCEAKDFDEAWSARVDSDGKPTCIMGHTQTFHRRKPEAECLVDDEFHEALPKFNACECTDADFECDYNFARDGTGQDCKPVGALTPPDGTCAKSEDNYMGSSGWRMIPGNDCKRTSGKQKDDLIERKCKETNKPIADGKISSQLHSFNHDIVQWYYREHVMKNEDEPAQEEAILTLTSDYVPHISRDHGKTWSVIEQAKGDTVIGIMPHQYDSDTAFIITTGKKVIYTKDRGQVFHSFEAPEPPPPKRSMQIMMFHPENNDWLMWIGGKDCKTGIEPSCNTVAHISTSRGEEWHVLLPYVEKCQFVSRHDQEKSVLCQQYVDENRDNPLQLVGSNDWFVNKKIYFKDVVNFATMSEFVVVATKDPKDKKWLNCDTSVDGNVFAKAEFPQGFQVPHQQAYTVLDSSTHAIFMHVTVNAIRGQEYGSIIKSNSNGTSYVLSISNVNRDETGYVDFEKVSGLEGVAIVNVVANAKDVDDGARKKVKTMMTHNDGADWALLPPPKVDAGGKAYECSGGIEKCSIHLHGYSERDDPRSTYGSPSAIGLVMGYGNVGEALSDDGTETYMSTDGGVSWKAVMPGHYMWEFGDQGSVVVLVEKGRSTRDLFYTLDEGANWIQYTFADRDMEIKSISTVPSDNSRNFVLWGKDFAINVDFTGLTDKKCKLDDVNPSSDASDYYLWEPKHPIQADDCLFGHKALYHRKKIDRQCYNGQMIDRLHDKSHNCPCSRRDFECDYNYERKTDGSCELVQGLEPVAADAVCAANPKLEEYYGITGYRRIPISSCVGGKEMDLTPQSYPCPGHEKQYAEKHRMSGVALFFVIAIPIAVAAGAGWWVWQNWGGKIGQIRLGDGGPGAFDWEGRWVQWPVAAVSGLVAVAAALPLLLSSLFRSARGWMPVSGGGAGYGQRTYTSRSSFSRQRADLSNAADEGELLGDESDEEV